MDLVCGLVYQMGIDSLVCYFNGWYCVFKVLFICLGVIDLINLEFIGVYMVFVNNGLFIKFYCIFCIEDKDGKKFYEGVFEENVAINFNVNYVMVEMLKYVVGFGGILKMEVGGKIGMINDYVDGWFMGIMFNFVVGIWVGGEYCWICFWFIQYGQGVVMAKLFFIDFIKAFEKNEEIDFDIEVWFSCFFGDIGIEMNCDEYQKN